MLIFATRSSLFIRMVCVRRAHGHTPTYVNKMFKEEPPQLACKKATGNIISEYETLHVDVDQL